jgi:ribosomal protein S18 acetylase RimI-like enzyme
MAEAELVIRPYRGTDEEAVVALWRRCNLVVPWNDPHQDIATKIAAQPELFFVGVVAGELVATVMAGYEGHRGWINYLAVAPEMQRRGFGRRTMEHAENALRALGCPKINLQVRGSNRAAIGFYERIGFSVDEVVSLGKRLRAAGTRQGSKGKD